jgi:hypothetical protein
MISQVVDELVILHDLAAELGVHRNSPRRVARRINIEPQRIRTGAAARGQQVLAVTKLEAELIRAQLQGELRNSSASTEVSNSGWGHFYVIHLEPEMDPNRFKVGFAVDVDERLRAHRTSAPLAQLKGSWPCRVRWEKTAIDAVTQECEQLGVEVFRARSLQQVVDACEVFFSMMPSHLDSGSSA